MGTAAHSRIQNRRNVLWLGLLLAVVAMIGGGSLVLNTPTATAADCYTKGRTTDRDCEGCRTPGGEWGREGCDWRVSMSGSHYCVTFGEDCYSD